MRLAGDELAQAIQLSVEYDPQAPFATGTPATAPGPIQDMVRAALRRTRQADGAARRRAVTGDGRRFDAPRIARH
jgi:hypothetical protein